MKIVKGRSLLACAFVAAALVPWALADCAAWFDAGVAGYESWPVGGAPKKIAGNGEWRGTQFAELSGAGGISFDTGLTGLRFALADGRAVSQDGLEVRTVAKVFYSDEPPLLDGKAKGAFAVIADDFVDTPRYFGVFSQDGVVNEWTELEGAVPPSEGDEVELAVQFREEGGEVFCRYSVDGAVLRRGGDEWLRIACGAGDITGVEYIGKGEVAALSGFRTGDVANVAFTPPAVPNAKVAKVSCALAEAEAFDGAYQVPEGALVVVEYEADMGYVASGSVIAAHVDAFAQAGLPQTAKASDALSITEVMASNGETLRTAKGGAGFDWVEIHNSAPFAVDITGWYLSDNPDKKPAKWKKIDGDGTIGPGEYKVFWAEKKYADWAEGEAWTPTGLSASGDPLFLADPRATKGKDAVVSIATIGKAIKDVSVGFVEGSLAYYREPTPGAPNASVWYGAPTPEVAFSVEHGYKDAAFELALSCPDEPGADIFYTLDGTSPNAASSRYSRPLNITGSTVVRAATLSADTILQRDTSATYLFLDDILSQGGEPPQGFPANEAVNKQRMDYAMNQDTVAKYRRRICDGFTNSISTVSLVIDPASLFDPETGIYVNARGDGREWERLAIVEMFSPTNAPDDIATSFPAGLRIRGGASRNANHPKHAFRLFFRSEYGMNKLNDDIFGGEAGSADEFDKLDLRTSQNFSWANEDNSAETFIHEVFARDSQRDIGQPYNRSRYYHLFINGVYWGLYQTEERVDDSYAESYVGGDAADYDVIRTSHDSNLNYKTGAVEGDERLWHRLWSVATTQGFAGDYAGNYAMLVDEGLLNPTNLMAYMLVSHYICDTDCPVAGSWDAPSPNNVQAFCNRKGTGDLKGFIFNKHDAEWSMVTSCREFRTNSYDTVLLGSEAGKGGSVFLRYDHFNPAVLHYRLMQNPEYKAAFMDYARRELTTGALSDAASIARFKARMAEIDSAISCEAARWGRGKTHDTWLNACSNCIGFIEGRGAALLKLYEKHEMMPIGAADALTNAVVKSVMAENDAYGDWLWEDIAANAEERAKVAEFAGTGEALKSCLLVGMQIDENPEVELSIPEFGFNPDGSISIGGAISVGGIEQSRPVRGRIRIYGADTVQGLGESVDAVDAGHEFPLVGFAIEPESGKKSKFFQLRLEP